MRSRKKTKKKKIIITIASLLVVCALGIGGFFLFRNRNADPVDVYSVETLNSYGFYGDESELTGTITSEYVQEVYPDSSQTIKKVYVKEGDEVKSGDKLLKYNVDEKELDLQLQKLQIQSSKYSIEKLEKELETLKNTKTVSSSDDSTQTEGAVNLSLVSGSNLLSLADNTLEEESTNGDQESPTVKSSSQDTNTEEESTEDTGSTEDTSTEDTSTEDTSSESTTETQESTTATTENTGGTTGTTGSSGGTEEAEYNIYLTFADGARSYVYAGNSYKLKVTEDGDVPSGLEMQWILMNQESEATALSDGVLTVSSDETAETLDITVILGDVSDTLIVDVKGGSSEVDDDDLAITDDSEITYSDDTYSDYTYSDDSSDSDDTTTYTASELKEAIAEKESDITKAKQELSEAKINYKEAKKEVQEATVKANISGTVTTAYAKNAAPSDGSPMIVVKAEDGMYVETDVSEMDLETVQVGGTITCTSWETNETYEATVISISDYPTSGVDNAGISNPNSSYYRVVAHIEDSGTLTTGESVNVTYNSQSMGTANADAIYLQKAYIRTEDNQSYVYKKGDNGRLEKQYVKTGTTVYGQYIEVLDGLTTEDQIAFPYGKNVKEGAKTNLSDNLENTIY